MVGDRVTRTQSLEKSSPIELRSDVDLLLERETKPLGGNVDGTRGQRTSFGRKKGF